jgi:hypothetical protein
MLQAGAGDGNLATLPIQADALDTSKGPIHPVTAH